MNWKLLLVLVFLTLGTQGCLMTPGYLGIGYHSPRVVCNTYGACAAYGGYNGGYAPMYAPAVGVYQPGYGQQVPGAYWDFPTNGQPFVPGGYSGMAAYQRWRQQGYH